MALALLAGCAGIPLQQPAPNQVLVTIKLSPQIARQSTALSLCDGRDCDRLKTRHGQLQVPGGKPLYAPNAALGQQREALSGRVGSTFDPTVRGAPPDKVGRARWHDRCGRRPVRAWNR